MCEGASSQVVPPDGSKVTSTIWGSEGARRGSEGVGVVQGGEGERRRGELSEGREAGSLRR